MGSLNTPYFDATTIAEVLITHAVLHGMDAMREDVPLALAMARPPLPRESLSRAARELREAGLKQLAAMLSKAARTAPRDKGLAKKRAWYRANCSKNDG
jgi:hypothetical protein